VASETSSPQRIDTAAVFRDHAAYAWRVLRRLGVDERDVEDVCQEVFIVVHRRLPEFEGRSSLRTWVYGVCVRVASDYRRRAGHRREIVTDAPPEQVSPDDPQRELAGREARAQLDAILSELDDDKRAVFVLHEIEQVTMSEIAEAVGCPLQTAYSRLHAARAKVAKGVTRLHEEAGRDEVPSAMQLAALAVKLGPIVGGVGGGGGGAARVGAGQVAGAGVAAKVMGGAAIVKMVAAGVAVAVLGVTAAHFGTRGPTRARETTTAPATPPAPATAPAPAPAPALAPAPAPATALAPATATGSATASAPAPLTPLPVSEVVLLEGAQDALARNPALALADCDDLARRFPHGLLDQEREVVAIDALVRLGRHDDANARAAKFAVAHPGSTHQRRIDAILGR
jgi:RNA polymerase sigma-70 factor (ECF subfamily)